jgi:hypothetical protein
MGESVREKPGGDQILGIRHPIIWEIVRFDVAGAVFLPIVRGGRLER